MAAYIPYPAYNTLRRPDKTRQRRHPAVRHQSLIRRLYVFQLSLYFPRPFIALSSP
ncbi:hypothetical protein CSM33_001107 [Salmonella enterica subsp. diarizonae]|nr:hypothetical protein [Salmonella enterica]EDQ0555557.1 hypothetical protein [Salmonella enterica subsp. diarizonae]EDQ4425640.1 hypothetical protein [Salmonella enterica subsp. salamae]EDQ6750746.1 hypothetical protein [Salmonella enterica subsp. enterica serovar O rough]EDQ7377816.1 hypothetical protein [Salmonella enterica subsp. diarizonae serovar 35:l,v:z35]EDR1379229.1 hypothetical protein [Salmonella enterica subsp. diarizonae serovar 61:r:z53]EDS4376430.1 hypothetical protein [Salmo